MTDRIPQSFSIPSKMRMFFINTIYFILNVVKGYSSSIDEISYFKYDFFEERVGVDTRYSLLANDIE